MSDKPNNNDAKQENATSPQKLFLAPVLISAGVIMLFNGLGFIDANIAALFSLWPLIIIYFGVRLLLRDYAKAWPFLMLAIITVTLIIGVTTAGWLSEDIEQNTQARITSQQDIDELALLLKTSAGSVTIDANPELDAVVDATLDSRTMSLASKKSYQNGTKSIELFLEGDKNWWPTSLKNDLDVVIGGTSVLSLSVDAGATDLKADLKNIEVKNLHLRLGASSNDITLGESSTSTNVTIDAGASSIVLQIPQSAQIILDARATVGSINADSLIKREDGFYVTADFDDASPAIDIKATIGAGTLTIKQY